jgi:hypothetical protein
VIIRPLSKAGRFIQNQPMRNPFTNRPVTQGVLGNFIFQLLWYAGGAIVSGISAYLAYVKDFPLWAIIPISAVSLCSFVWILNGIIWLKEKRTQDDLATDEPTNELSILSAPDSDVECLQLDYEAQLQERDRKIKSLEDTFLVVEMAAEGSRQDSARLKEEVLDYQIGLTERDKVIESLENNKTAYLEQIQNLLAANKSLQEMQNNDFRNELRQRDVMLDEIAFLLEPQRKQRDNIASYVYIRQLQYSGHDFENHPFPRITFVFRITNNSVFDITLKDEIKGRLNFRGEYLLAEKHFEKPPPIIEGFGGTGDVRIVQRLTEVEAASIKRAIQERVTRTNLNPPEIDFKEIGFTVIGSEKYPQVTARSLTIANGKASHRVNLENILR